MIHSTDLTDGLQMQCGGDLREIRAAVKHVETRLHASGLDKSVIEDLNLALTEAMTNIARHGYLGQAGDIHLSIRVDDTYLTCQLEDSGIAFDPTLLGHNAPNPSDLKEGGYGWYIIRKLSDQLFYAREDGRNRLNFRLPLTGLKDP